MRQLVVLGCILGTLTLFGVLAAKAEKTTITYSTWFGGRIAVAEKLAVESFEKKYPDIRIEITTIPWSQYTKKVVTMMAAGTTFDVYKADFYYLQGYIFTEQAMNLEPLIKRDKLDLSDYYPFSIEPCKSLLTGEIYAFPSNWSGLLYCYNKGLYDDAGIPYPDPKGTWTAEEWLEILKKLTRDFDGDGRTDQFGSDTDLAEFHQCFVISNGGRYLNDDRTKCLLNEPAAVEALKWMTDLRNVHRVVPTPGEEAAFPAGLGMLFEAGITAHHALWTSTIALYLDTWGKRHNVGLVHFPTLKRPIYYVKGDAMAISPFTTHVEEAWKFMKWYISPDYQYLQQEKIAMPSLVMEIAEKNLPNVKPPYDLSTILPLPGRDMWTLPFVPAYKELQDIWKSTLELVWIKDKTAKEAADIIVREVDRALDESWSKLGNPKIKAPQQIFTYSDMKRK